MSVVALAGCIDQDDDVVELPYKNDVITIEDFHVSDVTPYENAATIVDFLIKNNGEFSVEWVEVKFDTPGFLIEDLDCDGTPGELKYDDEVVNEGKCVFGKDHWLEGIDPFDTRNVALTLKVGDFGILHPKTYTVSYEVNYSYSGLRKMDIPIIDGVTRTRPMSKYRQSSQTYGPIHINFKPPIRGERIEDGNTIKEHWGVRDHSFKVVMEFKHVGRSDVDPEIGEGAVRLELDGLKTSEVSGVDLCPAFEKIGDYYYSTRGISVPREMTCSFQSTVFGDSQPTEPEITAIIMANYTYTYSFMNSQDFEIQPLPK